MIGAIISIIVNILITLSVLYGNSMNPTFRIYTSIFLGIFILISFIGTVAFNISRKKFAAIIAIIGFIVFFPIGLIGAISIRNIMDSEIKRNKMMEWASEEQ